jgi:hypothetical protein
MRVSSLQVTETEVAFVGYFACEPKRARLMILDFANVEQ